MTFEGRADYRISLLCSALFLLVSASSCSRFLANDKPSSAGVAFVGVTVLTMENGEVLDDQTVVTQNGRITVIGARESVVVPAGVNRIEGRDRILMPGLVDAHIHLRHADPGDLLAYVQTGITCAREMNGRPFLLEWRGRIEAGELVGPCLKVAAPTMGNFSSPREGFPTPQSQAEGAEAVRQFHRQGYDWIKVYTFLPREAFVGVVNESSVLGIPIGGHVPIEVGLADFLSTEVRSIEHMTEYVSSSLTNEAVVLDEADFRSIFGAGNVDWEKMDSQVKSTVKARIWNVPTLVWFDRNLPAPMATDAWADTELREQGAQNRREIVRRLHKAGALMAVGTDSDAGDDLEASAIHDELQALHEAGINTEDVLEMATIGGARLLGLIDEIGSVSIGKRADLLLLSCDPRDDLSCLRQPDLVIVRGKHIVK